MQRLVFRNPNGEEIDFTSGDFGVTKWKGFSKVDMEVQSQQVPFHDGSVFLDALLGERELSVTVAVNDDGDLEKRYRLKRELIHCLNPKLGKGELIYTNDYTSKKIVCVPDIPEFSDKNMNDSGTMKAMCSFTASNPYWEDVEETIVSFNADNYVEVENHGDVPCNIQARLYSKNVNKISLNNFTTGKKITIDGNFDNVIIDTNMGKKSVEAYNNKFNFTKSELGNSFTGGAHPVLPCVGKDIMVFHSFYSKNGIDYYSLNVTGHINQFLDIAYSPDLDLYIGLQLTTIYDKAMFFKSSDGINWEYLSQDDSILYPFRIFWSSLLNKFILCTNSEQNEIYTSSDGLTWTLKFNGTQHVVNFAESESTICLGELLGYVITTNDGENWSEQRIISDDIFNSEGLIWVPQYSKFFIAESGKGIFSSSDGLAWTLIYSVANGDVGVTFDTIKERLIICYTDGFNVYRVKESYNEGSTWNLLTTDTQYLLSAPIKFIPFLNIFYTQEYIFYDINNLIPTNAQSNSKDMVYSPDKKLLCSWNGSRSIVLDKSWNATYSDVFTSGVTQKYKLTYGKGFFWLHGITKIFKSADGVNWDIVSENTGLIADDTVKKFYYAKEIDAFIAVGNHGINYTNLTSLLRVSFDDCVTWQNYDNPDVRILYDVICFKRYSMPELYAVGSVGICLASRDGRNWQNFEIGVQNNLDLLGVTYCKSMNMVVFSTYDNIITWKSFNDWHKSDNFPWSSSFFKNGFVKWSDELKCFLYVCASPYNVCYLSFDAINYYELILQQGIYNRIEYFEENRSFCVGGSSLYVMDIVDRQNIIDSVSEDSDMNLNLSIGKNLLKITRDSGYANMVLTYKQKYLGV